MELEETNTPRESASEFFGSMAEKLGVAARAAAIFGDPVERDGVTVIPVAKARWGFGGGVGRKKDEDGAGGGGGAQVSPVGFIELKNGKAEFQPIRTVSLPWMIAWNKQLQPELRLSEKAAGEVVQQTENFSFAYLKELFVSATMQWMATRGEMSESTSIDEIILGQAVRLRAQMTPVAGSPASAASSVSASSCASEEGTVARALASARRFLGRA